MNLLNGRSAELVPQRRRGVPAPSPEDAAIVPSAGPARPGRGDDAGPAGGRPAASPARGPHGRAAAHSAEPSRPDEPGAAGGRPAAPDQPGREDSAVAQFIERFAAILAESGVPRMPARVFVALLAADSDRLSAADLAATLGVSPAAVSGAVRYLTQVGLVTGAGEPGSRRLFYSVPPDVWEQLMSMSNRRMARWTGVLRDGVEVLGSDTRAGQRVTESVRYFDFVAAELPGTLARWREYRAALDNEE